MLDKAYGLYARGVPAPRRQAFARHEFIWVTSGYCANYLTAASRQ
jgi:hypothetical protein